MVKGVEKAHALSNPNSLRVADLSVG